MQGQVAAQALAGDMSAAEKSFYQGKKFTMDYFYAYEMPRVEMLSRILMRSGAFLGPGAFGGV